MIVMEEGMAHLFVVGRNTSKLKAKIERRISKKKAYTSQHEKQKIKFYESITTALVQHFKEYAGQLKSLVIGSPGFTKDTFYQFLV